MQDAERRLLALLMPEGLLDYFDIMDVSQADKELHIHSHREALSVNFNFVPKHLIRQASMDCLLFDKGAEFHPYIHNPLTLS